MSITDLIGMLDVSGAEGTLTADVGVSVTGLDGLDSPVPDLSASTEITVQVDTGTLLSSVARAAGAATGLGDGLPDPVELVAPLTRTLDLLAPEGDGTDPVAALGELLEGLGAELENRDRDFLSTLEQLGVSFRDAPQAQALTSLLGVVFDGRGELDPQRLVGEALPATVGAVRGLAAAMTIESVLAESERLARILEVQLEGESVRSSLAGVRNAFEVGSFSLERLRAESSAPTPELLVDTLEAVRDFRLRFTEMVEFLNRSMGFGEATLLHLDVPGMVDRVNEYSGVLQGVDADVVSRAIRALMEPITPLLSATDLIEVPAESLDELLTLLETNAAAIAQGIEDAEVERIAEPVASALGAVTDVLGTVTDAAESLVEAVRGALETLKQAVEALPLDEIAATLQTALDPVREAMEFATHLVGDLQEQLDAVGGAATTAVTQAEAAIDAFKAQVDSALEEAATFVESLNLDEVVSKVTDGVGSFANVLGEAQVKPYFDTAVEGIDVAADVIGAVPLALLPEDMKAELDAAVAPLRAIDVDATTEEVKGWFLIEDGEFKLRAPLEDAVSDIQQEYDTFIKAVEQADPRNLIAPLEEGLATLREQVERLRLDVELAPLEEAVERVRGALDSFDLREELRPVDEAFATVLSTIEQYSPVALIEPLEQKLDEARDRLTELVKLDRWSGVLDDFEREVQALMDRADPSRLEGSFAVAHGEALRLVDELEGLRLGDAFGDLLAGMLSGGLPVRGWSVEALGRWLAGESSGEELAGRARAIASSITATRDAVASVDLATFREDVRSGSQELRAAIDDLPAGPKRDQALAILDDLEVDRTLARLEVNRARYATALVAAADGADTLARVGVSQVDATVGRLREALSPALALRTAFGQTLRIVGITDLDAALPDVIRAALAVATPARIAGILVPILTAIRGRIMAFLTTLLAPVRAGIGEIETLISTVDLTPIRESLEAVVTALTDEISALSPSAVLDPTLTAFEGFQAELEAFDPLGPARDIIDALREAALRILDKLDPEALLEHPITIYDEIMAALRAVSLDALLGPILDQLDVLAGQVDDGLDATADALERLQDALPSGGGGSSASVGVDVAVA